MGQDYQVIRKPGKRAQGVGDGATFPVIKTPNGEWAVPRLDYEKRTREIELEALFIESAANNHGKALEFLRLLVKERQEVLKKHRGIDRHLTAEVEKFLLDEEFKKEQDALQVKKLLGL